MLIGGKKVPEGASPRDIANMAFALPSTHYPAITEEMALKTRINSNEAFQASETGLYWLRYKGADHTHEQALENAVAWFEEAVSLNLSADVPAALAIGYYNLSESHKLLGDFDKAIEARENAVKNQLRMGNYSNIIPDSEYLVNLHKQNNTLDTFEAKMAGQLEGFGFFLSTDKEKVCAHAALGVIETDRGNTKEAREHYYAVYELQQGEIVPDAISVEQGEYGIVDEKRRIGTSNVQTCVTVILRDPRPPHKTALAHIDGGIDPHASLDAIFEKMPKGVQLDAYVMGGKWNNPTAEKNTFGVMETLNTHDVNIHVADIHTKTQPFSIVFDPKDATMTQALPGDTEGQKIRNGRRAVCCAGNKLLTEAFDLTKSPDRIPVKLSENEISIIRGYSDNKSFEEVAEHSDTKLVPTFIVTDKAKFAEEAIALKQGHDEATATLQKSIKTLIEEKGPVVDDKALYERIASTEKYIGSGSEQANQFIVDQVTSELTKEHPNVLNAVYADPPSYEASVTHVPPSSIDTPPVPSKGSSDSSLSNKDFLEKEFEVESKETSPSKQNTETKEQEVPDALKFEALSLGKEMLQAGGELPKLPSVSGDASRSSQEGSFSSQHSESFQEKLGQEAKKNGVGTSKS